MRVDWSRRRRILLDAVSRRITPKLPRSSLFGLPENDEDKNMDVDDPAEAERLKRLEEQWKYDADDVPPVGPEGADEQSRMLVGHYDPKYVYHLYCYFSAESDKYFQLLETYRV
jgi:enhancer of polycomb-like protein